MSTIGSGTSGFNPFITNFSSGSGTSSSSSGNPLALTGLASGIDTTTIVQELMSIERQPEIKLQNQVAAQNARKAALQDVQTQLQSLQQAEQALQSPALWAPTQTVSSSSPTAVSATLLSGAGPGGYQISVSQLALSWQHTYSYSAPAQDDTITIGGVQVTLAAGADINAAASAINSANDSPVYATVVTNGSGQQQLVLSSRQTGAANDFTLTDTGGALTQTAVSSGQDAQFTVNGGSTQTSASNVVTNAIPGVQLTLGALAPASNPVTVDVTAAQPDESAVQSAIQAFVTQYNNTVDDISAKLNETPVAKPQNATDAGKGVLYQDLGLTSLLDQLRESFSETFGSVSGYQTLGQVGLSTGAAVGSGGLNQDSIEGKITFNTATFASAFAANPSAVQSLFGGSVGANGFAQASDAVLQPQVGPGGVLDMSISDSNETTSELQARIAQMDVRLQQEQKNLQRQFAAMESAMQSSQAQGQWLTSQIAGLAHG